VPVAVPAAAVDASTVDEVTDPAAAQPGGALVCLDARRLVSDSRFRRNRPVES
jgi:hypothetical protein